MITVTFEDFVCSTSFEITSPVCSNFCVSLDVALRSAESAVAGKQFHSGGDIYFSESIIG